MNPRSGCPINLAIEILGDRWSLIIIRDIMFGNRRTYGELHAQSLEGIATNILANRLKRLQAEGLVTSRADPSHRQKIIYSLTEKSIALVPVLAHLGAWGTRFLPVSPELAARALALENGGPALWENFMMELRHIHLGGPPVAHSTHAELDAAFQAAQDTMRGEGHQDR